MSKLKPIPYIIEGKQRAVVRESDKAILIELNNTMTSNVMVLALKEMKDLHTVITKAIQTAEQGVQHDCNNQN